jgi:hypothetical protein
MKTLIKLFLIAGLLQPLLARAGYGTNDFFVTLEPDSTNLIPGALEAAATSIECQPAEKDADGHWGNKIAGLQLSVRFRKSVYQSGEPVYATIVYRNTRKDDIMRTFPVYGGDHDFGFVIKDEDGNRLKDSFVPWKANENPGYNLEWPGGTQYIYESDLKERFGLTNPGTYSVAVYRKLPNGKGVIYLYSSEAKVTIAQ